MLAKLLKFLPIIGIILFVYVLYTNDIFKIISTLEQINLFYLTLAILLLFPRTIIHTLKWNYILKKQDIDLPYGFVIKTYLISTFYGAVTPGWLGTYIRIPYIMKKCKIKLGKATSNLVIDTFIDVIAVFILVIIGSIIVFSSIPNLLQATLLTFSILIFLILYFKNKNRSEKYFKIVLKFLIPSRYREEINRQFDEFYENIPKMRFLIIPLLVSILSTLLAYTQIYIIALGLGIEVDYIYFLFIYPVTFLVELIPISVSGFGSRELVLMALFSTFSVPRDKIVLLSLSGYFVTVLVPTVIGAALVVKGIRKTKSTEDIFLI